MTQIRLKVPCRPCDGRGCYVHSQTTPVPCWHCQGKGWRFASMDAPDPKWARQFRADLRRRAKRADREDTLD